MMIRAGNVKITPAANASPAEAIDCTMFVSSGEWFLKNDWNIANEITAELQNNVANRGITIESAPLRQIQLPSRLTQSIEEKLQAEQESQRMSFVLMKEKQEAERKRIEAKGIADFQEIVSLKIL